MPDQLEGLAPFRGEFRYVFYVPRDLFDATVAFYRDALGFPVVGGFSTGTYFQASCRCRRGHY